MTILNVKNMKCRKVYARIASLNTEKKRIMS